MNRPLALLLIMAVCSVLAYSQAIPAVLPQSPPVSGWTKYHPSLALSVATGINFAASIVDIRLSNRYAGRGEHPCALEGNTLFANSDGTFKYGKAAAFNLGSDVAIFAFGYAVERLIPGKVGKIIAIAPTTPNAALHIRNDVLWWRYCG